MNEFRQVTDLARRPAEVIDVRRPNFVEPGPIERRDPAPLHLDGMLQQPAMRSQADGDALRTAQGMLITSAAYGAAALLIVAGILILARLVGVAGGRWSVWFLAGMVLWGCILLVALLLNHRQVLANSTPGVQRHEIDARTDVMFHAIDVHADLLRERWRLESLQDAQERRGGTK